MEEPRVGIVLDTDFDVDEHASAEESSAMTDALLRESEPGSQAGETKSLIIQVLSAPIWRKRCGESYRGEERIAG